MSLNKNYFTYCIMENGVFSKGDFKKWNRKFIIHFITFV